LYWCSFSSRNSRFDGMKVDYTIDRCAKLMEKARDRRHTVRGLVRRDARQASHCAGPYLKISGKYTTTGGGSASV